MDIVAPFFLNMKTTTTSAKKPTLVVAGLNQLLADSYALMANTHHAHWNIEGPEFFHMHQAFESQYDALFEAVDEIAERIRALGFYSLGGLRAFAQTTKIADFPTGQVSVHNFVAGLISGHEKALADAMALRETSGAANDLETQDLVIGRIQWHQKTLWMLKSCLKSS